MLFPYTLQTQHTSGLWTGARSPPRLPAVTAVSGSCVCWECQSLGESEAISFRWLSNYLCLHSLSFLCRWKLLAPVGWKQGNNCWTSSSYLCDHGLSVIENGDDESGLSLQIQQGNIVCLRVFVYLWCFHAKISRYTIFFTHHIFLVMSCLAWEYPSVSSHGRRKNRPREWTAAFTNRES